MAREDNAKQLPSDGRLFSGPRLGSRMRLGLRMGLGTASRQSALPDSVSLAASFMQQIGGRRPPLRP